METEKRLRAVQEESKMEVNVDSVPTNDLEYEDKQKSQESQLVYDGLRFNLLAQSSKALLHFPEHTMILITTLSFI